MPALVYASQNLSRAQTIYHLWSRSSRWKTNSEASQNAERPLTVTFPTCGSTSTATWLNFPLHLNWICCCLHVGGCSAGVLHSRPEIIINRHAYIYFLERAEEAEQMKWGRWKAFWGPALLSLINLHAYFNYLEAATFRVPLEFLAVYHNSGAVTGRRIMLGRALRYVCASIC